MYTIKPHWRNCQWGFYMDMWVCCGVLVEWLNVGENGGIVG